MKKHKIIILLNCIIILFLTNSIYSSHFIGFGAGINSGYSSEENAEVERSNNSNYLIEYEYSNEYRDLWLLHTSIFYKHIHDDKFSNDFIFMTLGIKYTPVYYRIKSNLTKKSFEKMGCLGCITAPVTLIYDPIIDAAYEIPMHPFIIFGVIIGNEFPVNNIVGYFIAPGITNGEFDIKLKINRYLDTNSFKNRFWEIGFELTGHFAFQKKFYRTRSLL